ncbi:pyridoxamine 5'-phosphate oxidase family protein [Sphingomonas morindae]|uniref:Pyridoxamine 5'-phosphate oxidase family protein n=1 Tax=Sphingomonas morindae TaxID=1541170 RepID=A0ABY4X927_9SPHN|nr:pyridoxamine 5'-phosphate oxidase family protein [Sphingomonas morindae]USI73427.1 pyridoxamine 5'-phosphate oxidase family protein [Sphingomonas morindae]
MAHGFLETLASPAIEAARAANGSADLWRDAKGARRFDRFTEAEAGFLAERDSFYMASVAENGWPYVQHRGGPPGFLRLLDDRTLGFADFSGNRQYLSLGNITADDRVALILMDYAARRRLKILARAQSRDCAGDPDLGARLAVPGYKARVERAILLRLEAFDWNCPQHITPRFTAEQVAAAVAPLHARIAALERENAALRPHARG